VKNRSGFRHEERADTGSSRRYDSTSIRSVGPGRSSPPPRPLLEVVLTSPAQRPSGQSFVTRRAIAQIVRAAVASSYGVTALADDGLAGRIGVRLGLRPSAVRVRLDDGIRVELRILVAAGTPVAEVARQVDSVVRYSIRQALDREIERITIRVGGIRVESGPIPVSRPIPESHPSENPLAERRSVAEAEVR
jgi:uncharacterized alkaline shock family protein YloU